MAYNLTPDQQKLYNELKKLSKTANQRILEIERRYGSKSWAVKKLNERLEVQNLQALSSTGRIKVSKGYSETQMKAIIKATKNFLKSETSTLRGIKKVSNQLKKNIRKTVSSDERQVSDEDIETLYSIFEDDDIDWLTKYVPPSDVWTAIQDAKENQDTFDEFIDRTNIKYRIEMENDVSIQLRLMKIYNKYVKD